MSCTLFFTRRNDHDYIWLLLHSDQPITETYTGWDLTGRTDAIPVLPSRRNQWRSGPDSPGSLTRHRTSTQDWWIWSLHHPESCNWRWYKSKQELSHSPGLVQPHYNIFQLNLPRGKCQNYRLLTEIHSRWHHKPFPQSKNTAKLDQNFQHIWNGSQPGPHE